jgi:hypothetical protein
VSRQIASDGTVELTAPGLRFVVSRRAPGVILVEIHGDDRDQLGALPFAELEAELARHAPSTLFFDTSQTSGARTEVREAWTAWFARNKSRLTAVHVLASSRFVSTAIGVAKHLSRTGELIRIADSKEAFDRALAAEIERRGR